MSGIDRLHHRIPHLKCQISLSLLPYLIPDQGPFTFLARPETYRYGTTPVNSPSAGPCRYSIYQSCARKFLYQGYLEYSQNTIFIWLQQRRNHFVSWVYICLKYVLPYICVWGLPLLYADAPYCTNLKISRRIQPSHCCEACFLTTNFPSGKMCK